MEDAGAVALIGNTATTYLNFSVAMVTGNQNPFAGFTPDEMGLFDALMHPDYNSIGEILKEEKVAAERVQGMGEDLISWHIYAMNILGDPSLNPFIGIPQEMNTTYQFYPGANPLITVQAVPNAYFAVTDENGIILGADFTGADGSGFLNLDQITTDNITLCLTAKNKIPFIEEINITEISQNLVPNTPNLLTNFPNPFNPTTTISFETTNLHELSRIEIYNLQGQIVKTFSNLQIIQSPNHQIFWDGTDQNNQSVSSGIYCSVLKQNGKTIASKKMMLLK